MRTSQARRAGRRTGRLRYGAGVVLPLLLLLLGGLPPVWASATGTDIGDASPHTSLTRWDWQGFGHDAQHSFAARTTLTPHDASRLKAAWTFHTGDAVTANPTIVGGTVYVGSWDGYFYALNLRNGTLRWRFRMHPQPAVIPQPGVTPRLLTNDGGLVTSSPWFEPGRGGRPDLIVFAGGYTLYALNAHTGRPYWWHDYTGRPERPPDPAHDSTRIFSSPVVVGDRVIVGVSSDQLPEHRGYVVAADLRTGAPDWEFQTDVNSAGQIQNDGCGGVWSSGTVVRALDVIVFTTSDCANANASPLSESVIALKITSGRQAWTFRPARPDPGCDQDFGASLNAGLGPDGTMTFLGAAGKDGTYYSLDPRHGTVRWKTNLVFGGPAGGFIGTTAYDGTHLYGSTGLGDVGNGPVCDPANPRDTPFQEPTVHALDAHTGSVLWQHTGAPSFGATTVAGDLTFNGPVQQGVQVRRKSTGALITTLRTSVPCWCGISVAGNAVVFGTGTAPQGAPDTITAFTPNGHPPTIPGRSS